MKSGIEVKNVEVVGLSESFARLRGQLRDFALLTKPRIVLLFALTGVSAMVMAKTDPAYTLKAEPLRFWLVFLGMVLTAGAANALNQYLDRDIDALMERTRQKRPLPAGRLSPQSALLFALVIGTLATWLLYEFGTPLAAWWGLFTIAFYVGVYTMWLKRLTPYNIVIGGAAGATAPLIGWAAATGHVSLGAWLMFAIIFVWTPPHFWALALCVKDEYAHASVPMLPVVKGDTHTRRQIFGYTVALVPLTLALFFTKDCGWLYLVGAVLLGAGFVQRAWAVLKGKDTKSAWRMFGYSIVYLLALYVVMMVDALAWGAEKIPYELRDVGITENFGAQVDLGLTFRDETGKVVPLRSVVNGKKPVLLFLAYYECPNLCNLFLNGATDVLKRIALSPGKDFEIVTVSIDPREDSALAAAKKSTLLSVLDKPGAGDGWHFWVNDRKAAPDAADIDSKKLAEQVGFHYRFDKDQDQYAHTSGIVVLTPDGKVSRYLYGIEFHPNDVRLALAEAGGDKIGSLADRLLLFCYHYDPKGKKYAIYATNLMRAGGGFTVFLVGGILTGFWRRNRRRGPPGNQENRHDSKNL